jgi:D-alanyl-D-alanine carboxypeptidase
MRFRGFGQVKRTKSALRQLSHRLLITLALLGLVGLLCGFGPPPAVVEDDHGNNPVDRNRLGQMGQMQVVKPTAKAAVIIDGESGAVIYDKDAHQRLAPASMTKIATAIVALEHGNLNDVVKVNINSQKFAAETESTVIGLMPGEELTLEQLLYGMLVFSGNDAAVAVAEYIGGTQENFMKMVNDKVQQLGLHDTHFVNPHGLDADNHYSSAYDMTMLARYAMQNPTFAKIVATKETTVKGKLGTYYLKNWNTLLWTYPGVDGVKTGDTDNAGQCVVLTAVKNGHRIYATLMNSQNRKADGPLMLDYAFQNYSWLPLSLAASNLNSYVDKNGNRYELTVQGTPNLIIVPWQSGLLHSFVARDPAADLADANKPAGTATFYLGTIEVGQLPVYAKLIQPATAGNVQPETTSAGH